MLFLFAWIASLNTGCVPFNPLTVFILNGSEWITLIAGTKQVQCAGSHLDLVQTRLTQVEKTLLFDDDLVDSVSVMEVLESVTEVKHEYQNLHKDIKEVQQLQKEMTASLQYQLRSMRQTFKVLKKRIESRTQPLPPFRSKSATPSPQHR